MIVGVDIGGTFTDLVINDGGTLSIYKLLSTPRDPSEAMLDGLRTVTGGDLTRLERVAHGSTVATNAILERKGARAALITTGGFHDLLAIGRQNRPDLYALHPTLPPPLIPRALSFGVPERLDHTGAELEPLDIAALNRILDTLAEQNVESVAVCLLYSFVNPAHEHRIRERIRARGVDWDVALSSEVLPEFREYERASATALEAYVRPVMMRYVSRLEAALPCPLRIMKSDGGVMNAARVHTQAILTALSGPAAGVIGAHHIARLAGFDHVITLDMGGTSTDVALIAGTPGRKAQSEIDGLPLRIRLLDIDTVGAGGGSIARVDAGGALRVGPESAGASPGPIIYGRGGTQVTVSDANAVLGRLDAGHFLGGRMALDLDSARTALAALGEQIGRDALDAAQGVLEIANASIERSVRRVSVARGHDPRGFTLVAFGGAGGLHACAIADRLQIPRVLIPRYPGVLCAFGLLVADVTLDLSRSLLLPLDGGTWAQAAGVLRELTAEAEASLRREGQFQRVTHRASLDMRYRGQAFELNVPLHPDDPFPVPLDRFHEAHTREYGYALPERVVEIVTVRVQSVGEVDKPALIAEPVSERDLTGTLFERASLHPGDRFSGEALVVQMDSTHYIAPGWHACVDGYHNLILERG